MGGVGHVSFSLLTFMQPVESGDKGYCYPIYVYMEGKMYRKGSALLPTEVECLRIIVDRELQRYDEKEDILTELADKFGLSGEKHGVNSFGDSRFGHDDILETGIWLN